MKGLIVGLMMGIVLSGCSDKWEGHQQTVYGSGEGIPVFMRASGEETAQELQYALYVFHKPVASADYVFEQEILLKADGRDTLRFMNQDLTQYTYRFLFTATPGKRPEIGVVGKDSEQLSETTLWSDVAVVAQSDSLTIDNYYAILDKEGKSILDEGNIQGTLTRLVGQMVFDFSRINTDINDPLDVVDTVAVSVLDRVYQIDVTYTGLSKGLKWGSDLTPRGIEPFMTFTRTVYPAMDVSFGVSIPQADKGLEIAASGKKGSARILGAYALPASATAKVTLVFHYYDTTPVCENNHGITPHVLTCYTPKELRLNVSDWSNGTGLTVLPDYYTLNRAGIYCNRIIDIGTTTGITLDTKWKNASK